MPRHKRRGGNQHSADTNDQNNDRFPSSVYNESRILAEELIDVTSSRTSAVDVFPQLFDITSKLIEVQKDCILRPTLGDATQRLKAAQLLLTEMSAQGVDCSAVEVAEFEGQGIGLKAARRIEKQDIVLEIPRNYILSSEGAFSSSIGDFLRSDPVCSGMSSMALAIYLLHEACRGSDSEWSSYIAALPASYSNCLYFTPSDLRLLKGSPAQERIAGDFRRICRQYGFFFVQLQKSSEAKDLSFRQRFTFEDFRWAVATVMSRNNPVPQASAIGCALGLIPLWDLGNHKFGEMTTDFDPEALVLRFHAMEEADANEQILFHYGNRSNVDLLTYAGFTLESNPFDKFPVRLGISDRDALCMQRTDILDVLGIGKTETFHLELDTTELPPPLLAFVRVFVMTEDELKMVSDSCVDLPSLNEAILRPKIGELSVIDKDVDSRVARFLQTRFKLLQMPLVRDWDKMEASNSTNFIKILIESETGLLKKASNLVESHLEKMSDAQGTTS